LAQTGTFVLLDWCDDYLMCKLCSFWLRLTDAAFYRTYSAQHCESMLRAAGFEVVRAERFRAGWPWGLMLFVCRKSHTPFSGFPDARFANHDHVAARTSASRSLS
jgi:hypothetical protein